MNLQDMTTQFTGLMNRRDLTANTALVSTFMAQGIMRAQRDLRVPAMEKKIAVTIGSDFSGLEIPNDLLQLKEIRPVANLKKLNKTNLDQAYVAASVQGIPRIYARDAGTWVIGPMPQAGDVINVTYYAEFTPLAAPTDENIVSMVAWDMIVFAALCEAATWFKDSRYDAFENKYQSIKQAFQDQSDEDELGDNAAVQPGLYYPPDDTAFEAVVF
jgi:hypothetical protein